MYCMNFCDWAIGLSGSTLVCMRPRFALCRTVMNVVVALTTTVSAITMLTWSGTDWCENSSLSPRCTPKMVAFCALTTTGTVSPYFGVVPGVHVVMARSTLNSAKNTIICGIIGRQPASGLTPFSL